MNTVVLPPAEPAEILMLYPGGYPVHLDVPQCDIGGAGTAMRFTLPLRGHNLPLRHARERKMVVALSGELRVRSGARVLAVLRPGEALLLPQGVGHRIFQHGPEPSTVGVALWPGRVEEAFRALARAVEARGFAREEAARILASFGLAWDNGATHEARGDVAVLPACVALERLPLLLAGALRERWRTWLRLSPGTGRANRIEGMEPGATLAPVNASKRS
ncbi:hypothetical protein B0920_04735 [Massilia sp. KIM]|uniref:cupin domain-containing protein n=1 Tax=Massilia sp. KIM TaxID=1955422 RepID=UPI00098FFBF8|nr:cupin domain-containing protein [Massilia sp. KIM]OON62745.1 hypothetical protein B0920_04735 [Massilia sp. KIM]